RTAEEIAKLIDANQTHPMEAKKKLGRDIVGFYYGADGAEAAAAEWQKRFSERQDPTDIKEHTIPRSELVDGKIWICKLLVLLGFAKSNNEARQLVSGGAVNLGPDREKVTDPKANVAITDGLIVRAGNRKVARVRLE